MLDQVVTSRMLKDLDQLQMYQHLETLCRMMAGMVWLWSTALTGLFSYFLLRMYWQSEFKLLPRS